MSIGSIWLVYIIIVIVVFVILMLPCWGVNFGVAINLFIAFIIGLIAAAIMMATVDVNSLTPDEKNWAALLVFVAVVIPIILALWVVASHCYAVWDEPKTKVLMACNNETGHCDPVAAKVHAGNTTIKAVFKGGESPLRPPMGMGTVGSATVSVPEF